MPCEDEGKDWSDATEDKKQQRWPMNHQKLRKKHGTASSSQPLEETNPAITLISDFWLPKLRQNKFLLFEAPSVWYFIMEIYRLIH